MNSQGKIRLARLISIAFGPPLLLIMAVSLVILSINGKGSAKLSWWVTCVMIAALVPFGFIYWLHKTKRVTTIYLYEKRERTIPYIATVVCIGVTLYALRRGQAPQILHLLMLTYLVNTLMLLLVNLLHKISAHAVGLASSLVVLTAHFGAVVTPCFLLIAVVGWARLSLHAHTRSEVIAGFTSGLLLSWVAVTFL